MVSSSEVSFQLPINLRSCTGSFKGAHGGIKSANCCYRNFSYQFGQLFFCKLWRGCLALDVWSGRSSFLIVFLGALGLPESPRWLVKVGKKEAALKILKRFGGVVFANQSLSQIESTLSNSVQKTTYSELFKKGIFPAILIGIGLAVFQQLSGINTVFNYAPKIFQSIGASQYDQLLQTVFIGGVNLIFTIAAMLLVDKLGRKPLMLFGFGGLAVLYLVIVQLLASSSATVTYYLLAAIGVYAMSLAPVTWVLISEIFPNKVRGKATSVAVMSLWAAYFLLVFSFPVLFEKFKDATFYFYAAICLAGFIFVLFKVKETKGQTLEELENTMNFH